MADLNGACTIGVTSSLTAAGSLYVVTAIAYGGTLAAGAVLTIDIEKKTAKVGVTDVRADITGAFPELYPGANVAVYTDGEVSRTVGVKVTHEERFA